MKKVKGLIILVICMLVTFNQNLVLSEPINSTLSSNNISQNTRSIQPAYRALLIGNYDYPGTSNDLQGPPNDVNRMYTIFNNAGFGLNQTKFSNIRKVTNATKQQVFDDIETTFNGATSNDVSYFFYSGHGASDDNTAYLCTVDENQDFISIDQLKQELDKIPGTKIIVLDSCFSGGFISRNLNTTVVGNNTSFNKKVIQKFTNSGTKYLTGSTYKVLTASSSTQTSVETYSDEDKLYLGVFTKFLTAGCGYNGEYYADTDSNNSVSLDEAYQYIKDNVTSQDVQLYPENDTFPFVENGYTGIESVKTPSISPDQGNYNTATISMNCGTDGAVIRYTTDGTDPTNTSTIYTQPFTVNSTTTVKAKAFKDGMNDSRISSKTFTIYSGFPESQHNYSENTDETWTYTVPNNPADIKINFDSLTEVEQDYDLIYVMDSNGNNISGSPFTGTQLSGKTLVVPGDTVKIRLKSDYATNKWGFKVNNIQPYTDVEVSGVTLNKTSLALSPNEKEQLTATVLPDDVINKNVTWSSTDTNVASVDKNGLVVAKNTGTAIIKAVTQNGNKEADCNVTVNNLQRVQTPNISPQEGDYNLLNNVTIDCGTDGAEIHYTTDGTEPTINSPLYSQPIIVTKTTTINAKAFKDGMNESYVDTKTYNIYTGYPESTHDYENNLDKTWTYTALGNPSSIYVTFNNSTYVEGDADDIYDCIYVMDKNGVNVAGSPFTGDQLSGKKIEVPGDTVKIRLSTDDSESYWGFKVDKIACAGTAVTGVSLNKTSGTIKIGQTEQLAATVMPEDAANTNLTWSSSDPSVAQVDTTGAVLGLKEGSSIITVTTEDGNKTAQCNMTVNNLDLAATPSITPDSGLYNIGKIEMTCDTDGAVIRYTTDGTEPNNLSTEYTQPLKLSASTTIKAKAFKSGMNDSLVATRTYNIFSGYPESKHEYDNNSDLTWTYVYQGTADSLDVTFDSQTSVEDGCDYIHVMDASWNEIEGSPFTATQLSGKTVKVNGNVVKIRLTSDDSNKDWGYKVTNIAPSAVPVTGVSLDKNTADLQPGQSLQLSADIAPASATNKNVTWKSSNENAATVTQSGCVTAIADGDAVITATTEDGNKTAQCNISVTEDIRNIPDCIIIGNSAFSMTYLMNSAHNDVITKAINILKDNYGTNYTDHIYYKLKAKNGDNILKLKDNTQVFESEIAASPITYTAADGSVKIYKFH